MRIGYGSNGPRPMTLVQFAHERGLVTTADVESHIHAGLRSMPTTKTYARWNATTLAWLQAERDATAAAYRAAIASGEIREFTADERLEMAARGHPDHASTQAAIRLLAKKRIPRDGGNQPDAPMQHIAVNE